jgi:DnaK suppressor protein
MIAGAAASLPGVDPDRARQLLAQERTRIEQARDAVDSQGPLEGSDRKEAGDRGSEDLYQDEFDEGRRDELRVEFAALERAEARLAAGTYGISVQSGEPIPDARLEALPLAERTVDEEQQYRRG